MDKKTTATLEETLEQIDDLVENVIGVLPGSWQEKRDFIVSWARDNASSNFGEFLSWFKDVDIE